MSIFNTEISSMESKNVFNWGYKVKNNITLSAEEKEISQVMDAFAKEIGKTGHDKDHVIAEFVKKVVTPEIYSVDGTLLEKMFNVGEIGEFDEAYYSVLPKNTIKVYDGARGGSVPKSYIDAGLVNPINAMLQTETQIKMSDLRRDGYKSIATLTTLSEEALQNEKFFRLMSAIDTLIAGGTAEQSIDNAGQTPLVASMDAMTTYLSDRGDGNEFMIGLNKYIRPIAKMAGFSNYLSDDMKNELNRTGKIKEYSGILLEGISGDRKTGHNQLVLPDNRILGVAGKIGDLNMKGELRILQEENIKKETIDLKFTGFELEYAITKLDKIARVVFA